MKLLKFKHIIFYLALLFSALLFYNRFFNNFIIPEKIIFDFQFRNLFEHFVWGFLPPILFFILFLGFFALFNKKINWKLGIFGYVAWVVIFVIIDVTYYCSNGWSVKILVDILGLVLASTYLHKQLPE